MVAVKTRLSVCFAVSAALLAGVGAAAETVERVVWGDVVGVEPIQAETRDAPRPACSAKKPAAATLAATLRWDLRPECARPDEPRVVGFRVRYQWDGRVYTKEMAERPGSRIPLLVKFSADPQTR